MRAGTPKKKSEAAGGKGAGGKRLFFSRGTHNVRDELQLPHFVG